nr:NAD-dependent epimerase/dehydratase family protein [Cyanobium sp. Aljojuca 7D2]
MRVFHVFGEGEAETCFWPYLRRAALAGEDLPMTGGEQIRDLMAVQDVAQAILCSTGNQSDKMPKVLIRNIGSGRTQTILEFAESWWVTFKAKGILLIGALPYRDGEVMRYVPEV